VSSGARLLLGGHVAQGVKCVACDGIVCMLCSIHSPALSRYCRGQFFEPTLLVDVSDNMAIAQVRV
jgi:hypothetical protein